jgi:hypothetical protein
VRRSFGQTLARACAWRLLRRLCRQQTKPLQFVVGEDDLLAAVPLFQVAQTGNMGKAADFCGREAEEDCGAVLTDLFLVNQTHAQDQTLRSGGEHATVQTCGLLSPVVSMRKLRKGWRLAKSAYLLTQTVQRFGTTNDVAAGRRGGPRARLDGWYWYKRAMPGLILDRRADSVTLGSNPPPTRERPRQTCLARRRTR